MHKTMDKNMNKKSIKKNYIYNLLQQILLVIVPIVTTPYLARVLGVDGVGTVSYVESVSAYFVLFATMGLSTFGQREISYVQDNQEKRTLIFWETFLLQCITSGIILVLYIIFSFQQMDYRLYLILIFNILSAAVNVTWFFQGIEEFGRIVSRNIIFKVINVIYIFLMVKSEKDMIFYLFGLSFFTFLGDVSLWFYLPRYVALPDWKRLRPFGHFKIVLSLFVPTIAIKVYTVLDKTMIGLITGSAFENGYYEQAIKIVKLTLTLVTALGTVMVPRIGYYFEKGEMEEVKRLMYRGYRFVWFLGTPLCLGLIGISPNFVPWFFGKEYQKVVLLIGILAFLILAIGISNVTGIQYLIPSKRQNIFTASVMVGAVTNFTLNMILIRKFQSMGAAIASLAAEILITVVQIYCVRKELKPSVILRAGIHYYIAGAVMSAVLYCIGNFLTPSIVHTLIMILCGACVYGGMLLVMKDEFLLAMIDMVVRKVHGE